MTDASTTPPAVGRFAPSPTGPLHFGSLIAALCSYAHAKHSGGHWRLRIDDIDTPRVVPGSADSILRSLESHGFEWDGAVIYQSHRNDAYREALVTLTERGHTYRCICSRKQIAAIARTGTEGPIYPGTCRALDNAAKNAQFATRLRVGTTEIHLNDAIQGAMCQNLGEAIGDFVIYRADGIAAYHLATVVDDIEMGVTEVIRGADLLNSTFRQAYLQSLLGAPLPTYGHFPVAVTREQLKISKQTNARALDPATASAYLVSALAFLGQNPPRDLQLSSTREIIRWAIDQWDTSRIPPQRSIITDHD